MKQILFICELAGKRVIQIAKDGTVSTFYTAQKGWYPTALTFFRGAAYILEYKDVENGTVGPRIIKYDETTTEEIFNYGTHKNRSFTPSNKETTGTKEQGGGFIWMLPLFVAGLVLVLFVVRIRRAVT